MRSGVARHRVKYAMNKLNTHRVANVLLRLSEPLTPSVYDLKRFNTPRVLIIGTRIESLADVVPRRTSDCNIPRKSLSLPCRVVVLVMSLPFVLAIVIVMVFVPCPCPCPIDIVILLVIFIAKL